MRRGISPRGSTVGWGSVRSWNGEVMGGGNRTSTREMRAQRGVSVAGRTMTGTYMPLSLPVSTPERDGTQQQAIPLRTKLKYTAVQYCSRIPRWRTCPRTAPGRSQTAFPASPTTRGAAAMAAAAPAPHARYRCRNVPFTYITPLALGHGVVMGTRGGSGDCK